MREFALSFWHQPGKIWPKSKRRWNARSGGIDALGHHIKSPGCRRDRFATLCRRCKIQQGWREHGADSGVVSQMRPLLDRINERVDKDWRNSCHRVLRWKKRFADSWYKSFAHQVCPYETFWGGMTFNNTSAAPLPPPPGGASQ
jgi:hypothetical protein